MTEGPYNPLAKLSLARSIEAELLARPVRPLADAAARRELRGAGVYVLYYHGDFDLYRPIVTLQPPTPIYVGKAIPTGGRIGGFNRSIERTLALSARLSRHAASIDATATLSAVDFAFRALAVDDIWIPLGENIVIETFQPLWNVAVTGFGNNPTGGPRAAQRGSDWDTLHPGRAGAGTVDLARLPAIRANIAAYVARLPSRA